MYVLLHIIYVLVKHCSQLSSLIQHDYIFFLARLFVFPRANNHCVLLLLRFQCFYYYFIFKLSGELRSSSSCVYIPYIIHHPS